MVLFTSCARETGGRTGRRDRHRQKERLRERQRQWQGQKERLRESEGGECLEGGVCETVRNV